MDGNREEELSIRLSLAQAWVHLWRKAFDALLHHGVNVRDTPEYKDDRLIDEAMASGNIRAGQSKYLEYLKRVGSGIDAAIHRKGFKRIK